MDLEGYKVWILKDNFTSMVGITVMSKFDNLNGKD